MEEGRKGKMEVEMSDHKSEKRAQAGGNIRRENCRGREEPGV